MAFRTAFVGAFIGKIVAAIFIAACIFLGFGPEEWVVMIAGHDIWPWLVRAVLIVFGLATLFFLTKQWATSRRREPVLKWKWRNRAKSIRLSSMLLTIAVILIGAGIVAGTMAVAMRLPAKNSSKTTKVSTPSAASELERVRDQLKIVRHPILLRDPIEIDGRKFIEAVKIALPLRNDAPIGLSYTVNNVTTIIEGKTAIPQIPYPSQGPTILQGEEVTFRADYMKLENIPCGPVMGEVHFDISYGIPGSEKFSLKRKLSFVVNFDAQTCNIVTQTWNWIPD
jgi:hypothetical protein